MTTAESAQSIRARWLSPIGLASALACAAAGLLLLLSPSAASAATFSETICRSGSSSGQCTNPKAVALDPSGGPGAADGSLYVADRNNLRVDAFDATTGHFLAAFGTGVRNGAHELQTCTTVCGAGPVFGGLLPETLAVDPATHVVYVGESGDVQEFSYNSASHEFEFLRSFGGGVLDGGATGTGTLTAGSAEVTGLVTTSREFRIGQTITGAGVPAGTRVVERHFSGSNVTGLLLSNHVTASGSAVSLTAPTPPAHNSVNEVQEVSLPGPHTGGSFALKTFGGQTGGRITADTASGSKTIGSAAGILRDVQLTAGSKETGVSGSYATYGFKPGQTIAGPGIPPGTTITEKNQFTGALVLSAAATATGEEPLSATAHGSGKLTAGSKEVTGLTNAEEFVGAGTGPPEQTIFGAGIPAGTTVVAVNESAGTLTLSAPATASGTGVSLSAATRPPIYPGLAVTGPGIPAGATVASVAANGDITLSEAATATASGTLLGTGIPYDATAATLKADLEGLPKIGAGNVSVTGPAGGPWEVEFKGHFADVNVQEMSGEGAALTPSVAVSVSTKVPGAGGYEVCTAQEVAEGYLCDPGASGHGEGRLPSAFPLSLDPTTHELWAGATGAVQGYAEDGSYEGEVALSGAGEVAGLAALPAGGFYALVLAHNEIQSFTPPGSGKYTLTFEGQTTGELEFNAPKAGGTGPTASVQNALESLSTIGAGNVEIGGLESGPREVLFVGSLSATNLPQIEISPAGSVETVREGSSATLRKFGPAGEPLGALDSSGHPQALGLDPATGALYVGDCPRQVGVGGTCPGYGLQRYDSTGAQTEAWGGGEVIGDPQGNALAFDPAAQRLYLAFGAGGAESAAQIFSLPPAGPLIEAGSTKAAPVRKLTATFKALVDPEGHETKDRFQYITKAQFEKNEEEGHEGFTGAQETPLSASIGEDFAFHEATAALTGLKPATAYRYRALATNSAGEVRGETATFETLPPATVDASAADVTASSATLLAQINPLGEATTYSFEYLTEAQFEANGEAFSGPDPATSVPDPAVSLGAGEEAVSVSQHLQGLQPHTAYRYRVLATNAVAPQGFPSPTLAFVTQAPAAAVLPDSRRWELVSPPDKHGATLGAIGQEGVIQAAASGEAITYEANAPTEPEPQGFAAAVQVLSARAPSGWSSRDLAAPHPKETGLVVGAGHEYNFFSEDLSVGVLQPFGAFEPSLSPEATEQTPYLRTDFGSEPAAFCSESCYRPLFTPQDVASGAKFGVCYGEGQSGETRTLCGPQFLAASPDARHIVLASSGPALTKEPTPPAGSLYLWSAAAPPAEALRSLDILPDGAPSPPGELLDIGGVGKDGEAGSGRIARGAISTDGSRVFLSGPGHLYLRLNATEEQSHVSGGAVDGSQCTEAAKACTIQLDAIQGGSGDGGAAAAFQFASADGSRAFFTDSQALTPDAGANGRAPDLYEYDLEKPLGQRLTDLTPAVGGESAAVQGLVPGASEDGSYLYFVADGALAPGAQPGHCLIAGGRLPTGTCNLYLRHDGATSFIATLSADDYPDWDGGFFSLGALAARVSPDGRWLAFQSDRSLTGYDNRDAATGRPDEEVFLYHAPAAGGEQGSLICASCNPTGARPHGVEYGEGTNPGMPLTGGYDVWGENTTQGIAANIPGWTPFAAGGKARYQSRFLSDRGRLFFNSHDALSPADTNGTEDVYEYEPPQGPEEPPADTCTPQSLEYVPASRGCVSLISSGTSPEESAFLDASETGEDVFFLTNSRLSPLDYDSARDVYDAHTCAAQSPSCPPLPPPPKPSCEGDSCQQPAVPPNDPTPGSLTFHGAGNVHEEAPTPRRECPKGKVSKHGKCVKKPTKHRKRKAHRKHGGGR